MTSRICTSDRKGVKFGISGESPTTCPPCEMMLWRKWSGNALRMRPSVRFWGLIGRFWPATPSPLASVPWQFAQ